MKPTEKKRQGFAAFTPEQHKAASSKGGSYKGRKGAATLTPEQRRNNASYASRIRWQRVRAKRLADENST